MAALGKITVISLCVLSLSACTSGDQSRILKDITDSAIDSVMGSGTSSSTTNSQVTDTRSTKSGKENFYITKATVHEPDFGDVSITTAKNPSGLTEAAFGNIVHKDSNGKLAAKIYLYPVSSEGFIVSDPVYLFRGITVLNSGKYYLKSESNQHKLIATGFVDIQKGVTNKINLGLE
ncbi:hypothetical protein [Vibrio scophthalmi]|uniref:Lipoprotein n=1 Tax=Vibrio scophthalmi LMG 19158 TaxID=870967 RepID=F9RNF8_9VIBR|nr:hypothetical protein [Vibrio scophthalmi]EGU36983.1 hypothetical protein VIS19158_17721 [Vibrio scophthalmi LMG 19158]